MKNAKWALYCFLALASCFSSCKKEKQDPSKPLIGSWKGTANPTGSPAAFEITLAENGTVTNLKWGSLGATLSNANSYWSVSGNTFHFHIEAFSLGGLDNADGTGTVSGTTITGTFTNTRIFGTASVSTGSFSLVKQ